MNLNFAENLKRLRKEKSVTQEQIADVLGVSSQSISRWELSICYPDIELLPSIANYFGVTVDSLLSNDVLSQEEDLKIFNETIDDLSSITTERIDFVKKYCNKYPENDYFAYHLVLSIKYHVQGYNEEKRKKYMPLMTKVAQRLLDSQYRYSVIQLMASVCDEDELDMWLKMAPYNSGFSRRYCLITRARSNNDWYMSYVQQGLEKLEGLADYLDRRCPDQIGAERKLAYQRSVLQTIESFGNSDEVPDGWKMFYAYKQLVLAACLFGRKETEEGWKNFDAAIEKCKHVLSLNDEWLDVGGELFSNIKVGKNWNYAIDENGNKHKLFAAVRFSFYDMSDISDLLTNPHWAWFNSVRDTEKYRAAVEWVRAMEAKLDE